MSLEWECLPLAGEVKEDCLEEVTSEWGFAGIPNQVGEEEQGLGLLSVSSPAISILRGLPVVNSDFHLSLCVCEECQDSHLKLLVE